jgi:CRISPR-associated exonuclease Cas4
MYFFLALVFLAFAAALFWLSEKQRTRLGLPEGRVLYSDTGTRREIEALLFADDLYLVGKPDYLVESREGLIPVELKSGRTPIKPFDSHIYQLAAYCLLVQRNYRRRPPYGIIRYPEQSFAVEFTRDLEERLVKLLAEMQSTSEVSELHRSHIQPGRCAACGYGELCEERL